MGWVKVRQNQHMLELALVAENLLRLHSEHIKPSFGAEYLDEYHDAERGQAFIDRKRARSRGALRRVTQTATFPLRLFDSCATLALVL